MARRTPPSHHPPSADDTTYMAEALEWALRYVAKGFAVFPCHGVKADRSCTCGTPGCPAIGKHPRTTRGLKDASCDQAQIEHWFGPKAPLSNVAIRTGKISGLTVIDVDKGPGKVGGETWATRIEGHGEPSTLMARTGSGGLHVFFQHCADLKTGNDRLGKHVDVKNDGGCVIVTPSRHKSGGGYTWVNPGTPVASLPAHLLPHPADQPVKRGRPRQDAARRRHYRLQEVGAMLAVIPADDRDHWRHVGIILGREFKRSDEAWNIYVEWSNTWDGARASNHDAVMSEAFHQISEQSADRELSMGTIVKEALAHGWVPKSGGMPIEDFVFYAPEGDFVYRPTLDSWGATSVNVAVSPINIEGEMVKASEWLKRNRCVSSLACDPLIEGTLAHGMNCVNGELIPSIGAACLNTYRRPTIALGEAAQAGPFIAHCRLVMPKPGDADQFLNYMAHRAQHPGEKPRFALLIGGEQGVGKDTSVELCVPTLGVWNVANIAPSALSTPFNEFVAATLVRISETANQKEMSRFVFNELVKVLIAGSPDFCMVNPKYGHKFTVRLHGGVIITTNHLLSGIFIPQDVRRYDVIECATKIEMGLEDDATRRTYFETLWAWFHADGARHVAAYLHARDLTGFSASNGQRKTNAHQMVIQNSMSGDEWFTDALEAEGNPDLFRGDVLMLRAVCHGEDAAEVRGKLPHAAERAGFKRYQSTAKDGRWLNGDKKKCALFLRQGVAIPTRAAREKVLSIAMNALLKTMPEAHSKY